MKIGVDYYPEQWDKSMWSHDAEIARIMGGDSPSELMLDNARAEIEKAASL